MFIGGHFRGITVGSTSLSPDLIFYIFILSACQDHND